MSDNRLTRIGVFYDGGYLQYVSDYYRFHHERASRLSIRGLHTFIEHQVARAEGVDPHYCHVVDAHYFRGRFSVDEVSARGKLEGERAFDDVLMRENVVTHYLPRNSQGEEKGIDVWLALEAYELAAFKKFNVVALVASDGDYVPLVRKLSTLGTCVMLLAWDFTYEYQGRMHETRTSQQLINEVTYPIHMVTIIDNRSLRQDPVVNGLFTDSSAGGQQPYRAVPDDTSSSGMRGEVRSEAYVGSVGDDAAGPRDLGRSRAYGTNGGEGRSTANAAESHIVQDHTGVISDMNRDRHFGIIDDGQKTWLFLGTELEGVTFEELRPGDHVRFGLQPNPEKPGQQMAARVCREADTAAVAQETVEEHR